MTKKLIYRLFSLFIVSFITVLTVTGQEVPQPIHRSSEKVIIGGKVYYIHVVKKGQTLYSISKAYNVPQKVISRENPILVTGLQEGMVLKIPYAPESDTGNQPVTHQHDTGHYIYHNFGEGETLYSLSKKYNVSVEDILKANPGIKPDDIPIGMEIKIPGNRVAPEHIEFTPRQEKFRTHRVLTGETLYSIARQYQVTVDDLLKANDNLQEAIHPGQEIRIPEKESIASQPEEQVQDTMVVSPVYFEQPISCDTIPLLGAETEWHVALLLPLYLDKNNERSYIDSSRIDPSTGKRIRKLIRRERDWIYPPTLNILSFYEGVMLGLDTLGKRGVHAEVTVFDTDRDASVVDSLLRSGALDKMDLIIGPVYPSNLSLVAEWARSRQIPVVSPLSRKEEFLHFNPYTFECRPSKKTEWLRIIRYLAQNLDKNIVIIHAEDTVVQKNYEWVKGQLLEDISHYAHPEIIGIKEVIVPSIISPTDTMNNILLSLDKDRENLVWVFSDREGFVSEVSSRLNTVYKDYPIDLVGCSAWRYFKNIELDYFFRLNLRLFTPHFVDFTAGKEKSFIKKYRSKYYADPSALSFAWDGYDITTWFLTALYRYGNSFPDCAATYHAPVSIREFRFGRTGWFSGFMNQSFQLIRYNNDYTISVEPFPEADIPR